MQEYSFNGYIRKEFLPWVFVQKTDNFKDDKLKHGTWEGKVDTKYQLDEDVMELVVPEQHLDKEYPPHKKEDYLASQDYKGIT